MKESERSSLPFENIAEPEQKISQGQFSEIKELENQGHVIKILKEDSLKSYAAQLDFDPSVLNNPLETAKIVKVETDLLDNSSGGITEMIPPHRLIITGNSQEDFKVVTVMKKVEGNNFRTADELFDTSENSLILQKQFQELLEASLVVFDESVERRDLRVPDIIQIYQDGDGSAGFKNIMVGAVEGEDRKVWLVDTFPLLRMRNEREAFSMLNSYKNAIKEFDEKVYYSWFENNKEALKEKLSDPEFSGEVEEHRKSITWLRGQELKDLDDNSREYLLSDFFKTKYWGKGATEWDKVRSAMEQSVDKRLLGVNERLEKAYIAEASAEFNTKSRFNVENILISPEAQRQFLPEIWNSGKFFIPFKVSELEAALENGITVKNMEVCLNSESSLFTETSYFKKISGVFEAGSREEEEICYLVYTNSSPRGELCDIPYGCKIKNKLGGRTFIEMDERYGKFKDSVNKIDFKIPYYEVDAVVTGNPDSFRKVSKNVLNSKLAWIPVFELSERK